MFFSKLIIQLILAILIFPATSWAQQDTIILQSTTSTQNSGLLEFILPKFERETGIEVRIIAVGTGQALKNAENGDGDVVLVHARDAEEAFVEAGFGVERYDVMYNDFVIVGPANDPAGIGGSDDAVAALDKIAESQSLFASRGDDSGTYKKELALWSETDVDISDASGRWYRETGSGMGATLNVALGMEAYVLTDRATWLAFQNKRSFEILFEGDARLFNPYGVMLVNPDRHNHVNAEDGQALIDWLISAPGQSAIGDFQVDGQQLFFPNAK